MPIKWIILVYLIYYSFNKIINIIHMLINERAGLKQGLPPVADSAYGLELANLGLQLVIGSLSMYFLKGVIIPADNFWLILLASILVSLVIEVIDFLLVGVPKSIVDGRKAAKAKQEAKKKKENIKPTYKETSK